MAKETAKTEITFNGVTYPFYRTMRGRYDYEMAGFTTADMLVKVSAQLAYIYFQVRDCAKHAKNEIKVSLNEFIDAADEELLEVYARLLEKENEIANKEKLSDQKGGDSGKPQEETAGNKASTT